jgi:isopenicillin N synthase-like dioxygenase
MASTDKLTSIAILDYELLSSPDTRPVFFQQLQYALVDVGFFYLEHPPVPDALIDEVIAYLPRVFALPQERKEALRMRNTPYFLGYSRIGAETTKGAADQREQFDLATYYESKWAPGKPDYLRQWGPSQVRFFACFVPPPALPEAPPISKISPVRADGQRTRF